MADRGLHGPDADGRAVGRPRHLTRRGGDDEDHAPTRPSRRPTRKSPVPRACSSVRARPDRGARADRVHDRPVLPVGHAQGLGWMRDQRQAARAARPARRSRPPPAAASGRPRRWPGGSARRQTGTPARVGGRHLGHELAQRLDLRGLGALRGQGGGRAGHGGAEVVQIAQVLDRQAFQPPACLLGRQGRDGLADDGAAAAAAPRLHVAGLPQDGEGLPQRHRRDAEPLGQLGLGRQPLPDLQDAEPDGLPQASHGLLHQARAADRREDGVARQGQRLAHGRMSASSAARRSSGSGTGRRSRRSTNTCTKWPSAAGASSPSANRPSS